MPLLTGSPVERWACDLAGPFPKSTKGHAYILTAICAFTKYIILVPLRDKTAIFVAKAIFEKVFLKFGAGEVLTDSGGEFRCELLDELCRLMGVTRSYTNSFQPKTNELCERSHLTINSMLAKCVSANQKNWTNHQQLAFCFNMSIQEARRHTLFFLMHETEPRWRVDLQINSESTRTAYSVNDYRTS